MPHREVKTVAGSEWLTDKDGVFWRYDFNEHLYYPVNIDGQWTEENDIRPPGVSVAQLVRAGLQPNPASETDALWKYCNYLEGVLRANGQM